LEQTAVATRRALTIYQECDFVPGVVGALCTLGFIAEVQADGEVAERHHRAALAQARRASDARALALCLEGLAGVALLNDDPQRCAALLGGAFRLREERALPPEAVAEMVGAFRAWNAGSLDDRLEALRIEGAVRDRLETEAFEAAYAVGRGAALDDLIGG
jgi:hypothetical protein